MTRGKINNKIQNLYSMPLLKSVIQNLCNGEKIIVYRLKNDNTIANDEGTSIP